MKSFCLLLAVLVGIFSVLNAHPGFGRPATFEYCAQYPEIECKFWSPIDSTCRWCDNMNRCAPYCLQQLPQAGGNGTQPLPSSPSAQAQNQVLQQPQAQLPQQNLLAPLPQQPQPQLQQPNFLFPQQPQQAPNLLLPQHQQPLLQMPQPFNNLFTQNNLLGQPQQPLFPPPQQQPRWIL